MAVKRIISDKQRKNLKYEQKIKKRIREMAIQSLKTSGGLPKDYK